MHHPDDDARRTAIWKESLRTGKPFEVEYRLKRHDGVFRWHLCRATPARDRLGSVTRWFGTNTDIHDQKETARRLKEAIRARDEFLSIASHELKTPLTSLKLQTQLFQRGLTRNDPGVLDPSRFRKFVDQSEKQVSRLTRLVDDMLDIARIRAGRLAVKRENLNLTELVREVVDRFASSMREAKTPVTRGPMELVQGQWDRLRIEQAIINLLIELPMSEAQVSPVEVRHAV